MGCWNGTCALTNMPIHYNENVVLFLLFESPFEENMGGGTSYCDQEWYPFTLPIFGKYNDYGSIEFIDTENYVNKVTKKYIEKLFKENKLIFTQPESEYEKINFNSNDIRLEQFINIIERGYISYSVREFYSITKKETCRVGFMMAHLDAYQRIIQDMSNREYHRNKTTFFSKLCNDLYKYRCEYNARKKTHEKLLDFPINLNIFYDMFSFTYSGMKFYLREIFETQNEEYDNQLSNATISFVMFKVAMGLMRKKFTTQCGVGSQCDEMHLHNILAEFVQEHTQKKYFDYFSENVNEDKITIQEFFSESI